MENNLFTYVFALVVIVVAFLVVKKVASCLIRSVVLLATIALLAYLYYVYRG